VTGSVALEDEVEKAKIGTEMICLKKATGLRPAAKRTSRPVVTKKCRASPAMTVRV
jgi:hypothetical protein